MLHFTCDVCGQPLRDERYVAHIEVRPAFDPNEVTESDLDDDHLQQVAQLLENTDGSTESSADADQHTFRFDFCRECLDRYVTDPLGRESWRRLNFSEN